MTTKKKSYAARLGVLALALTLMTTCLLGGTMAKYTTEITGKGSATVAQWKFEANGGTSEFNIDLANTKYSNVVDKKIAPGTKGSFDIILDATGSEVGVAYSIKLLAPPNLPDGFEFYSSDTDSKEKIDLTKPLTGKIELGPSTSAIKDTVTKTIYWEWPGTGSDDKDTDAGKTPSTMTLGITITGEQQTPDKSVTA